ncbi:hypothetical protein ANCCEY_01172 [Ancylostoma ceylanicum]|uniref:Uncharacterized protein n=1 Tax=Ancylostoma ceylanicum TaxID=53326 RepID=A0A0D6M8K5_9BILA|nr:hypothetical protein ANCCEY_01172 [Ancylostoma ceylanicum]
MPEKVREVPVSKIFIAAERAVAKRTEKKLRRVKRRKARFGFGMGGMGCCGMGMGMMGGCGMDMMPGMMCPMMGMGMMPGMGMMYPGMGCGMGMGMGFPGMMGC